MLAQGIASGSHQPAWKRVTSPDAAGVFPDWAVFAALALFVVKRGYRRGQKKKKLRPWLRLLISSEKKVYKTPAAPQRKVFFFFISLYFSSNFSLSLCNSLLSLSPPPSPPPSLLPTLPLSLTSPPLWLPSPLVVLRSLTAHTLTLLLPTSPLTRVPLTSNSPLVPLLWPLVLCWLCK